MTHIKRVSFFLLLATIFSSCFNAKNLDKYIATQYPDFNQPSKKKPVDGITISSSITGDDYASRSKSGSKMKLPLIVYWRWDFTNACTLNPAIPFKDFSNAVNTTANKALKPKLNGRKLELTVEQMPNSFSFHEKAHLVFLVYGFGWGTINVQSEEKDLIVSYKVLDDGTAAKAGKIHIPYGNDKRNIGYYEPWKKVTDEFLTNYQANITRMSKLVVEHLMKEI